MNEKLLSQKATRWHIIFHCSTYSYSMTDYPACINIIWKFKQVARIGNGIVFMDS